MAINVICMTCKNNFSMGAKKCPKCNTAMQGSHKGYRVIVWQGTKRVTRVVSNLELARELESKFKVDIARGEHSIGRNKPSLKLIDIWKRYLPWAQQNKKSWTTDQYYYEKHLAPVFGNKELDRISPFDIERLILSMKNGKNKHNKSYAQATIKHQIVLLSRLYSLADNWGLYDGSNPCKKVKKPKLNNQKTEFLTDDQLARLLEVLNSWPDKMSACFVKFALLTGMRRGEMFKLKWEHVNLELKTITIKDPKGKIDQILPLSDEALKVLAQVPRHEDISFVFFGRKGNQRTDFKGPWLRIRQAADLPKDFRLHGLRHHFASHLVSNGVDIYTVQKLLCHKDASTTQRYAHLADSTLRNALNLAGSMVAPKVNEYSISSDIKTEKVA
jgi:integrase